MGLSLYGLVAFCDWSQHMTVAVDADCISVANTHTRKLNTVWA